MLATLCLATLASREALFRDAFMHYESSGDEETYRALQAIYNGHESINISTLEVILEGNYLILDQVHWAMLVILCDRASDNKDRIYAAVKQFIVDVGLTDEEESQLFAYFFLSSQGQCFDQEWYESIASIMLGEDNLEAWIVLLADPACPENILRDISIAEVRALSSKIFDELKNVDSSVAVKVLGHFARLGDSGITLQLIRLGLSPDFSLKIISDVFEPIPVPDVFDHRIFYLFFFKKKLILHPNENQHTAMVASHGIKLAIDMVPVANKTEELMAYFLKPGLELYQERIQQQVSQALVEEKRSEQIEADSSMPIAGAQKSSRAVKFFQECGEYGVTLYSEQNKRSIFSDENLGYWFGYIPPEKRF